MIWLKGILTALFLASLLAFSHALLKWVSLQNKGSYFELLVHHWWTVGFSILIYVFIFFYYVYALQTIPLTVLYPAYTGISILLVVAIGSMYFGESFDAIHAFGSALIIVGVSILTYRGT